VETYTANAPLHVIAIRTPEAKYATYSNWPQDGIAPSEQGQEAELYDYRTQNGRLEIENSAERSDLEDRLRAQYEHAFRHELREPLPGRLQPAHAGGFADYFLTARHAATVAVERRQRRAEAGLIGIASLKRPPLTDR
jgi:hypothetical protein